MDSSLIKFRKICSCIALGVTLFSAGAAIAQQCGTVTGSRGVGVERVSFGSGGGTRVTTSNYYTLDTAEGTETATLSIESAVSDSDVVSRAKSLMSGSGSFANAFRNAMNADDLFLRDGDIIERREADPNDPNNPPGQGVCQKVASAASNYWPEPGVNPILDVNFGECVAISREYLRTLEDNTPPSYNYPFRGVIDEYTSSGRCGYTLGMAQCTTCGNSSLSRWYLTPPCEQGDLPSVEDANDFANSHEDRVLSDSEIVSKLGSMGPAASQQFFSTPSGRPISAFDADRAAGGDSFEACTPGENVGTGGGGFYEFDPVGGEPAPPRGAWTERPGSGPPVSAAEQNAVERRNQSGADVFSDGPDSPVPPAPGEGGDLTVDAFCANASQDYLMCTVDNQGQTIDEFCDSEENYAMCDQIDSEAIGDLDSSYGSVLTTVDTGLIGPLDALGNNPVIDGQGYTDPSGSGCPAPIDINMTSTGMFSDYSLEINTDVACQVAQDFVKPVLILFATWAAFAIIVGARGPTMPTASVH